MAREKRNTQRTWDLLAVLLGGALLFALAAGCATSNDEPSAKAEVADDGGDQGALEGGCRRWDLLGEPSTAPASPVPFVQLVAIESFEWPSEFTLVLTPRSSRNEAIIAAVRTRQAELGEESVVEGVRDEPPNVVLELDRSADPTLVYEQLEAVRVPCSAG